MVQRVSLEMMTPVGVRVDHLLTVQDQPEQLLILLPGRGYTCDFPVLYYLRNAAADMGYDVLSVRYSFQVAPQVESQVTMQQLATEVDQAIHETLKRGYRRVCIVGKSLGTPLAALHADQAERLILLTPIGTAAQEVGNKPTLAIIGTADQVYHPDVTRSTGANVRWMVLEGLDHGLEVRGDWSDSLDALRQITQACVEFIE